VSIIWERLPFRLLGYGVNRKKNVTMVNGLQDQLILLRTNITEVEVVISE
jgi:hypothetical protein